MDTTEYLVVAAKYRQSQDDMITRFTRKIEENLPKNFEVKTAKGRVGVKVEDFGDDNNSLCYYVEGMEKGALDRIKTVLKNKGINENITDIEHKFPTNSWRKFVLREKKGIWGSSETKMVIELRTLYPIENLPDFNAPVGLPVTSEIESKFSKKAKKGNYIHILGLASLTGFTDDVTEGVRSGLISSGKVLDNVLVGYTDLTKPIHKQLTYTDTWFEDYRDSFTVELSEDFLRKVEKVREKEEKLIKEVMELVEDTFTKVTTDFVTIEDVLKIAKEMHKPRVTGETIEKAFKELSNMGEGTIIKENEKIVAFNFGRR